MQTDARTLTQADLSRLVRRALFAEDLIERMLGRAPDGSSTDLALIDELFQRRLVTQDDAYALSCLGVVIGARLLEDMEGLTWFPLDARRTSYLLHDPNSGRLVSPLLLLELRLSSGMSLSSLYRALCADLRRAPRIGLA